MAAGTRRVKSVEDSIRDTDEPEHRLKKHLSGLDLTVFGVGVIIGTGIFVLTGVVAKTTAGPGRRDLVRHRRRRLRPRGPLLRRVRLHRAGRRARPTRSPTPRSASSSPGSSAGTSSWSSRSAPRPSRSAGRATSTSCSATSASRCPPRSPGEEATVNIPAILIALLMTGVLVLGIKLSARVTAVDRRDQGRDRAARDRGRALLRARPTNYSPVHPADASRPRPAPGWTAPLLQTLFGFTPEHVRRRRHPRRRVDRLLRLHRLRRGRHRGRGDARTRSGTCPAASSARWRSARCSTSRSRSSWSACRLHRAGRRGAAGRRLPLVGLPSAPALISVGALAGLTTVVMVLLLGQCGCSSR